MSVKQDKYIKSISRKVKVCGIEFNSAMDAARFIHTSEQEKNLKTIAKEIRKCISGLRPEWYMYGKYNVERI